MKQTIVSITLENREGKIVKGHALYFESEPKAKEFYDLMEEAFDLYQTARIKEKEELLKPVWAETREVD